MKEKDKNKVIEFLKEIATSSISSVVASGFLYAIGSINSIQKNTLCSKKY